MEQHRKVDLLGFFSTFIIYQIHIYFNQFPLFVKKINKLQPYCY